MSIKKALPYFTLVSNILDDVFLGYVLLHLSPLVAMPVWYLSAAVSGLVGLVVLRVGKDQLKSLLNHWPYTLCFLFFSILSGLGWFFSVYYLGISGNTVLEQSHYVVVIFWSILVLKESLTRQEWVGAGTIFAGILLFASEAGVQTDLTGMLAALVMVIGVAGTVITKKHVAHKINHNALVTLRALALVGLTFIAGLSFNDWQLPAYDFSWLLWAGLLIGGFIGAGLSHYFSMAALKHNTLSSFMFVQMMHPLAIILAGVLLYGDNMTTTQFIAAGFVLAGKIVLVAKKKPNKLTA